MSSKIEEGDLRGAIRLASSNSTIASPGEVTFCALEDKHPPSPADYSPPPPPVVSLPISVSQAEIARAVKSFPLGSSAGPDGLRPQHLKDILSSLPPDSYSPFLSALAAFSSLVLEGNTPSQVGHYFFGARLIALDKCGGGVCPIAIGCVLRRLVAKVACFRVSEDMADIFSSLQLGFGVKGGIEAAVHAGCHFLECLSPDEAVVKLDFSNAFKPYLLWLGIGLGKGLSLSLNGSSDVEEKYQ